MATRNLNATFITSTGTSQTEPSRRLSRSFDRGRLVQLHGELSQTIDGLDHRISGMMTKQENDYLSAFKFYVVSKEDEVKQLQEKLQKTEGLVRRNQDKSIRWLQDHVELKTQETDYLNEMCRELKKELSSWKSKALTLAEDNGFLERSTRSSLREAKILRYFLLQVELFLSEQMNAPATTESGELRAKVGALAAGIARFNKLDGAEALAEGLEGVGNGLFSQPQAPGFVQAALAQSHKRTQSTAVGAAADTRTVPSPKEKERPPPIVEKKGKEYADSVLAARVAQLTRLAERQEHEIRALKSKLVHIRGQSSDLATTFLDCITESRKEQQRRKVREAQSRRRYQSGTAAQSESDKDLLNIELLRRVGEGKTVGELTEGEKARVMDLFLRNDAVIRRIYEAMFPPVPPRHKVNASFNGASEKMDLCDKPEGAPQIGNVFVPQIVAERSRVRQRSLHCGTETQSSRDRSIRAKPAERAGDQCIAIYDSLRTAKDEVQPAGKLPKLRRGLNVTDRIQENVPAIQSMSLRRKHV